MRFQQTKEILEHAQALHHQLQLFCEQVSAETEQERVKLLVDYIARHERNLETALSLYEEDASQRLLATWFDVVPKLTVPASFKNLKNIGRLSTTEVVQIAIDFDNHLIAYYEYLAENAQSEELKDIFTNLLSMEQQEKNRLVMSALRLEDL